jgi:hypothetical protein
VRLPRPSAGVVWGRDCGREVKPDPAKPVKRPDANTAFLTIGESGWSVRGASRSLSFEEHRQAGVLNGTRAYFHDPDATVLEYRFHEKTRQIDRIADRHGLHETVGGSIAIAAITKHEGFQWVQRQKGFSTSRI